MGEWDNTNKSSRSRHHLPHNALERVRLSQENPPAHLVEHLGTGRGSVDWSLIDFSPAPAGRVDGFHLTTELRSRQFRVVLPQLNYQAATPTFGLKARNPDSLGFIVYQCSGKNLAYGGIMVGRQTEGEVEEMTTASKSVSSPALSGAVALERVAVRLHAEDHVAIAKADLPAGLNLAVDVGGQSRALVVVHELIPIGHKLALRQVPAGEPVRRYGQVIGLATKDVKPGEHVHIHNLNADPFAREYAFGADVQPVPAITESERRTFLGYRRPDGQVGTRNYVAVISTVNCSAHASREIAGYFTPERLAAYPNVDGVIALTHPLGCPVRQILLQRTLAGMARHPNVGGYLLVGLGCETNQMAVLMADYGLCNGQEGCPPGLNIQDLGGIRKTVEAGIETVERMLPVVNAVRRTKNLVSELGLALQCGGSDSWSGVTANPVVGLVSDEIVRQGGTVVLAETPEIYGAEHLLTRRAINAEVGQKLVDQVRWWEQYARRMGLAIDDNRSVGNAAGGLTTIYEKSLGAVAKAGSTPLTGVYDYAERVTAPGFAFMDSPGYDPASVTGQVAAGCNVVLFTTGRGSVFGFKPAPCIKISTNTTTYERMIDDMDLNAGQVLEGVPMEEVAAELLDLVLAVASGQPSKSESQGVGEAEFCPWNPEGTL
jgi:altronate hydrolase